MTLPQPATLAHHDPEAVYLAGLAPGSRPSVRSGFATIRAILRQPAHAAPPGALAHLRDALRDGWSLGHANKLLAYVRGTLHAAHRLGLLDREALAVRLESVPGIRGHRVPPGRALTTDEIDRVYRVVPPEDRAALGLLVDAGLRTHELIALTWERVTDHDGDGTSVTVTGKGNHERTVPLGRRPGYWLRWWRDHRPANAPVCRLSGRGLRAALTRWCVAARIYPRVAPHSLRRTYVSRLLDAGADVVTVQHLVGHQDPRTTASYDRRTADTLRDAVALLDDDIGQTDEDSA